MTTSTKRKRLKIAFLCETHPDKTWAHSGGHTRMFNTLQEHVGDVTYLGESWGTLDFIRKLILKLPESVNLRLRFRVHWLLSRFISSHIRKQLQKDNYDVLFCCYGFYCLNHLKPPYPLVSIFTSDATFTVYKYSTVGEQFESFFSLSRRLDPLLKKAEQNVYRHTDLLLWPSEWMRSSVNTLFNISDDKSMMIPWGANILPPAKEELLNHSISDTPLRLLLVGRDWYPKGGPMVYETLLKLLDHGINAELTVVGCTPPEEFQHPQVRVYPHLNKDIAEEYQTFTNLYRQAHFFVMPSYEAYGFAFCEASAYGLPTLCLNVGGVPIKEGINGHALEKEASAEDFCNKILAYREQPEAYSELRKTTRDYYEAYLNWPAWANKVALLIAEHPKTQNSTLD